MIVGVTGDTHNNLKNIKEICSIFNENRTDLVFHTGDISLPKSLLAFKDLKCPLIAVFGNNDIGEKKDLLKAALEFKCEIHEEPFFVSLNNKKFVILHHPDLINNDLVLQNHFIFHGHTHRYRKEIIEECTIYNPGECAGMMKGKNQIGILDLSSSKIKTLNF